MINDPKSTRHRRVNWKCLGWTLFALLLIFNLIFFGFDAYPIVERKIARIGIGTLDSELFDKRVVERSVSMLEKPHPFRVNDETRYILLEHLFGRMAIDASRLDTEAAIEIPGDDWLLREDTSPLGILALGVINYATRSGSPQQFIPALEGYASRFLNGDEGLRFQPTNVEQTCQGIAMVYLAEVTGNPKYRRGADEIAAFYLDTFRRTGQVFPYVVWQTDKFVLVDTVGMMGPFLVRYAALTGNREAADLAVFQLEDFLKHGLNPMTGIPFHGYNPTRDNCPIGVATWGRGSGWLALGLQEIVKWLPEDHPRKPFLIEAYKRLADALRQKQRDDGTWGNMLSLAVAQTDSSATAMICNFFMYGREAKILGPDYDQPIESAMEALRRNTRKDGTLDFCQGPPVDMNRHSRTWGPNRYGQGALMSCLSYKERPRQNAKASQGTP